MMPVQREQIHEKTKPRRKPGPKKKRKATPEVPATKAIRLWGKVESDEKKLPPVPRVVDDIFGKNQRVNWTRTTAQLMKVSCAFTAQELLMGPQEEPYNGKFFISDHHLEWDKLVVKHKRLCILAPRDSGKTYFFDFAYPIWQIINNPGKTGFIFSATQPLAERILGDIKSELENNTKLNWLVPVKKEHWRASSIKCSNGFKLYGKGFGTKIRGAHPNFIIVDDGLTDETAYSELVRKKQIDYFYTAITNMIVPNGQIIVVGTPFAKEDLYGNLKKNPEYRFVKYEALKDGKALWPERYSVKDLKRREREIGSVRFAREFLCCKGNTYVETIAGHVPIEDVQIGTLVLTHKNRWRKVTRTFENDYVGNLIRFKNTLEVTPNHRILTQDGWKEAGDIVHSDFIMYPTEQGEDWMEVIDIQITYHEGKVYNLEVTEDNSYIADGVAVHNCNPIDDSSSFFPRRLFQGDPVEQYGIKLGMPREFWEDKGVSIYMGVDFAMSTSVEADYTVIWVMGKDAHGNRWIIDIKRGKGMPYQEQLSLINAIGRKYQPALIHLEANQMQRIFGDELIRTSDLPIRKFTTGIQKHSLEIGLPSMRILLENQKFRIPRGDQAAITATDLWIDELSSFTYENGRLQTVGAHDDLAMASWICNEAIRIGGFQFSFGLTQKESDEIKAIRNAEKEQGKKAETVNVDGDEIFEGDLLPDMFNLGGGEIVSSEKNKNGGNGRGNGNGSAKPSKKPAVNLVDDDRRLQHSLPNLPNWY
jgi:intein/homing endonuclease